MRFPTGPANAKGGVGLKEALMGARSRSSRCPVPLLRELADAARVDWWMFIPAREDPWSNTIYEAGRAHGQGKYRVLRGLAPAACGSSGAVGPYRKLRPSRTPSAGADRRLALRLGHRWPTVAPAADVKTARQ
jgi:hypothetical protein